MSIDTLEYVERKVAEAHVKAMNVHVMPELATSADIDRLEKTTRTDIDRLESGTRAEIARLEQKIETMVQRMEATCGRAPSPPWAECSRLAAC
jgi:hypothetical protein